MTVIRLLLPFLFLLSACASAPPVADATLTGDAEIRAFVEVNQGGQVGTLWVKGEACTADGFSRLHRLGGIEILEIADRRTGVPMKEVDGRFLFGPVLSDEIVDQIAWIKGLKELRVWYGSVTGEQRARLRKNLPGCTIADNMNKI